MSFLPRVASAAAEPTVPGTGDSLVVTPEDIRKRVVVAGGSVNGVIVASLAWSTADDLDLHVQTPDGTEINYQHRQAAGGELDVDMCVSGKHGKFCTERPVENVVFLHRAPKGRYEVYVQNFNFHANVRSREVQVADILEGRKRSKEERMNRIMDTSRPVPFEMLLQVEGSTRLVSGVCTPLGKTHAASNTPVFSFDYWPEAPTDEERFVLVFEAASDPACIQFKEQLLLGDSPRSAQKRLPGSGGTARLDGARSSGVSGGQQRGPAAKAWSSRSTPSSRVGGPNKGRGTGGTLSRKLEDDKRRAVDAVRAGSRDTLLAKPAKAHCCCFYL